MGNLISIVTPSFNQGCYIEQTIDSIKSQNYPSHEHIIIDGGSRDNTVNILKQQDNDLTYWISESDRGQTHAINKGFARSTGTILAYLNSDDFYLPGCFQSVADAAERNPDADLFVGRCRYVDQAGSTIGSHFGNISSFADICDLWDVWWSGRQFVQPEVFWTRRIADKIGMFNEDLYFVMDYEFWARALRAGAKVVKIDRELSAFRFTPDQKSNQSRKVARELLDVVKPWLWDPGAPLSPTVRRRLKANWAYDSEFLHLREKLVEEGVRRSERWLRLAMSVLTHPRMLTCPAFRRNIFSILNRQSP